jgi:hypothetical protein
MGYLKKVFFFTFQRGATSLYKVMSPQITHELAPREIERTLVNCSLTPRENSMRIREPTRPILRTYIKTKGKKIGEYGYGSLIVNPKTGESFGSTKPTIEESVKVVRRKVGVR